MKLQEIRHANRLPKKIKKNVWRYSLKKMFGFKFLNEEKEANQTLRMLAVTKGAVEELNKEELSWKIELFNSHIKLVTRRYPSSDLGILFQVLGKLEYKPLIDIARNKFGNNSTLRIVDAGANVGYASLYFKAAFPSAEIICLEVDPDNVNQIKKNINLNSVKGVQIIENALWKRNAHLLVKRDFRDKSECSFYVEEVEHATGLKGYNLDHFLELNKWDQIDILKIDIEGGERYLFETDELADQLLKKTKLLAIEIHDEFNIRGILNQHLTRNGFQYFNHGDITIAQRI